MLRFPPAALSLFCITGFCITGASAAELTLALPEGTPVHQVKTSYTCPTLGALTVAYVTAGDAALAVFPVDGKMWIFANVLSGSGARYAAGPYVWWTKGPTASLYDLRKGEGSDPLVCEEKR